MNLAAASTENFMANAADQQTILEVEPKMLTACLAMGPIPQSIQERARREVWASGFRRLEIWPVQFHNPCKKPDVGSGLMAVDVLGCGPSDSTIHAKIGPT